MALKNITVKINDRDKIGIVGRTGAGKSSVTVALYRLVNVESGSIKISGVNIADIGRYWIILQKTHFWIRFLF